MNRWCLSINGFIRGRAARPGLFIRERADLKNPTVEEVLKNAVERLDAAGIDDPAVDAAFLLTHLLKLKRHELFLEPRRKLTHEEAATFEGFVERRAAREPAQYITGECEFRGLAMSVTADTLIPRPETELLVDEALAAAAWFADAAPIVAVDLCTGSGCIAVSLASELAGCRVYATDNSTAALDVARANAVAHGVAENIEFLAGDLFTPLAGLKAHVIVSNPPYVPADELEKLEPEVGVWEPRSALLGGANGLDFYRKITHDAPAHLLPNGCLIMELGFGQAAAVRELVEKDGRYTDVWITKDYAGIERIVRARLKNK